MIPTDYGRRTGVTAFIKLLSSMCRLFEVYEASIRNWIVSSGMTEPQKAQVLAVINAVKDICVIIPFLRSIDD